MALIWSTPKYGLRTGLTPKDSQPDNKRSIGIWCEHFITPIERLETNYASLKHKPGVAQIPGSEFPTHDLTAYWGAGRDRIPAAAYDLFKPPEDTTGPDTPPRGVGEYLTGTNYDNMYVRVITRTLLQANRIHEPRLFCARVYCGGTSV